MVVYKIIKQFDQNTGREIDPRKVPDHMICDFTGQKIEDWENPNTYDIAYNDNDPSFGDSEGEGWLYKWSEENDIEVDSYDLFGGNNYCFKRGDWEGTEVFQKLIEEAMKELDEIYSLDHLLRWSRARMLEKVIKEGRYKIEQFID